MFIAKWSGEGEEEQGKKKEVKWDLLVTGYNLLWVRSMEAFLIKFAAEFVVLV